MGHQKRKLYKIERDRECISFLKNIKAKTNFKYHCHGLIRRKQLLIKDFVFT